MVEAQSTVDQYTPSPPHVGTVSQRRGSVGSGTHSSVPPPLAPPAGVTAPRVGEKDNKTTVGSLRILSPIFFSIFEDSHQKRSAVIAIDQENDLVRRDLSAPISFRAAPGCRVREAARAAPDRLEPVAVCSSVPARAAPPPPGAVCRAALTACFADGRRS